MMHVQRTFGGDIAVDVDLDDMSAGAIETHIGKKRHVVRVPVWLNRKLRWSRDHNFFPIRRENFDVGLEVAVSNPVIYDRKLQESRWKALKEDVLEHSHQR